MSERFDCKECAESLYGRKYIQELFYEERHYHEHCFRCLRCERSLADEPFTPQGEGLVCNTCYCSEFSSKCVACDRTVMPGSRKLEYAGTTWHEDCFVCRGCEKPIGGQAFIPDKDEYYCVPCYEARLAPRCSHCKKAPLAGQPFTSQGESPYCVKCFSNIYAQKCAGCNTAITGFGDGKYVSFQERQWHQPCFKCSRCSVSLVGAGFFPDRDHILCSDCNSDE
ncbi:hypothetical protein NHX12_023531 [Muraenolepis orangiensis]|uniref:LIM zinc-binding domain-containing protein n=1 Tax=Muraenolepis orangiensis TaxID=630683 RepID=A0A9Q0ENU0_9TELE|nr:hypothetical protein NHX12_023531 [Muraenolepis orangiensis]